MHGNALTHPNTVGPIATYQGRLVPLPEGRYDLHHTRLTDAQFQAFQPGPGAELLDALAANGYLGKAENGTFAFTFEGEQALAVLQDCQKAVIR